jgi:hypothetical protein
MTSPFPHRRNKDGSYDSICPKCFATIARATTDRELLAFDQKHVCDNSLTAWYRGAVGLIDRLKLG